jgi:DNA-binding NarL/FixJ family response regulator
LIVDDHPLVRRGLTQLIADEPDLKVCGEAADASEALRQVRATHPALVVIDISLKSSNGIELIKQIKALDKQIMMLVLSMHDESLYAERALHAGAMGYIEKEQATDHIIEAIRHVLEGKVYLSGDMTERLLQRIAGLERLEHSAIDRLSDRELEVFELIGSGLTTRQIAEKVHLSVKTIETHRDNIRTKLKLGSGAELIHYAVRCVLEDS